MRLYSGYLLIPLHSQLSSGRSCCPNIRHMERNHGPRDIDPLPVLFFAKSISCPHTLGCVRLGDDLQAYTHDYF